MSGVCFVGASILLALLLMCLVVAVMWVNALIDDAAQPTAPPPRSRPSSQGRDERLIRAAVYSSIPSDQRAPIAGEFYDTIIDHVDRGES